MRRLLATSILALLALCALSGAAMAKTPKPVVTSFSPAQVPVGQTLVIKGKNFRSGARNNRVFLSRSTDGKTVRVTPKKASKTRIEIVIPSAVTKFLTGAPDAPKATRFQIAIFTKVLGPKTKKSRSPIILPAGSNVPGGGGGGGTTGGGGTPTVTASDCDGDGTPNDVDNDDDNDLIGDDTEKSLGTDPCKADSDGDGLSDGFEYYSALDYNSNALPYPGKRPFPNPLDGSDANVDFDRDGLTDADEYAAWVITGTAHLPLNYSAGKRATDGVTPDGNKDADGDGLTNLTELARLSTDLFNPARKPDVAGLMQLDWLTADSDGDTINDGADDNDHDGLSNIEEITPGDDGILTDPEDPTSGSVDCDNDGTPNSSDSDDDNDGLPDSLEKTVGLSPCNADTDGDGVEDGFEYYSALDLNGNNNPYPGGRPYPNALDGTDANSDFDGDGMTQTDEYKAWVAVGNRVLPAAAGQSFPYSDGNQTSPAPNGLNAMDLDENGRITDEEKDADNDKLPNWLELVKGDDPPVAAPGNACAFAPSDDAAGYGTYINIYTDCGLGRMPNGNIFGKLDNGHTITGGLAPAFSQTNILSYLKHDSDGDGIQDGDDDQDFDGVSNIQEITAGTDGLLTAPKDPCDPDPDARSCPTHASHT